jgi:hypothetical protein
VAYYGGLPGIAARHAGPSELEYLPANAAIVAYADVADVMRSDFRQRMREVIPDADKDKGRQEFQQATGIDIEKDIDGVTAAMVPGADNKMPLVVIRGRFDEGRIEAFAREHGATVDTYQNVRIIGMPAERHHQDPGDAEAAEPMERHHEAMAKIRPAMAFVEPGLLLFGPVDHVRGAIDHKKDGQNLTTNTELMARISRLESNANAWALGRMDVLAERASMPREMAEKMPALTWFEAAGHVNGGMSGVLKAEARDAESAKNMRDMLNGIMAFGRLQAQSNPEVQALMQAVSLEGSGKNIELRFTVPAELIDAAMAKAQGKKVEKM